MQEIAINRLWTEKEYKDGGKVVGDSDSWSTCLTAKIVILYGNLNSIIIESVAGVVTRLFKPVTFKYFKGTWWFNYRPRDRHL